MQLKNARKLAFADLRAELAISSQEFLAIVKTGNVFGAELRVVAEKHEQALKRIKSFFISKPGDAQ